MRRHPDHDPQGSPAPAFTLALLLIGIVTAQAPQLGPGSRTHGAIAEIGTQLAQADPRNGHAPSHIGAVVRTTGPEQLVKASPP